jgi:glycosyltransferase involved in cell wall biosynthesis
MSKPKILHIAPENFAGMPMDFVKMHRAAGYESRLITMYRTPVKYDEDISLDLHVPQNKLSKKWRQNKFVDKTKSPDKVKYYSEKNIFEKIYFSLRDFKNRDKISEAIKKYNLYDFDIYHFDGGMDFFRNSGFAKRLRTMNKKLVMCYFGSDLRTRGIFREMESISDLNLTVEFDHTEIYKNIHFLFFPAGPAGTSVPKRNYSEIIKVLHSPTNRIFKGTDNILKVIEKLKMKFDFEFVLAENMERNELLNLKKQCHLAIDTVGGVCGGSGYGKNSIENLSLGLPTITEFTPEYFKFLPENPFIVADINSLYDVMSDIFIHPQILKRYADEGIKWVTKYHGFESVNKRLEELYMKAGIL